MKQYCHTGFDAEKVIHANYSESGGAALETKVIETPASNVASSQPATKEWCLLSEIGRGISLGKLVTTFRFC
jgi:hypothetical protein